MFAATFLSLNTLTTANLPSMSQYATTVHFPLSFPYTLSMKNQNINKSKCTLLQSIKYSDYCRCLSYDENKL